jgi:hypothetical protein
MSVVPANRESDAAIEKRVQETVLNDPSAESSCAFRAIVNAQIAAS